MNWLAIATAAWGVLQKLGVVDWLLTWVKNHLLTVAKGMRGKVPADPVAAHESLYDAALAAAPYFAFARKRLLKKLRAAGPNPDAVALAALRTSAADAAAE